MTPQEVIFYNEQYPYQDTASQSSVFSSQQQLHRILGFFNVDRGGPLPYLAI